MKILKRFSKVLLLIIILMVEIKIFKMIIILNMVVAFHSIEIQRTPQKISLIDLCKIGIIVNR